MVEERRRVVVADAVAHGVVGPGVTPGYLVGAALAVAALWPGPLEVAGDPFGRRRREVAVAVALFKKKEEETEVRRFFFEKQDFKTLHF